MDHTKKQTNKQTNKKKNMVVLMLNAAVQKATKGERKKGKEKKSTSE